MMNIFRARQDSSAIGNLSLCMATHTIECINQKQPVLFHKDVLANGRGECIDFINICENDVPECNGYGRIYGLVHLRFPDIGQTMKQIIKPSKKLEEYMITLRPKLKTCVAAFHIRRGACSEDSFKFSSGHTFGSDTAVEAMIQEANKLNEPVYILSDSESTKKLFLKNVPKAISLDLSIEHTSDKCEMDSLAEWFLLSEIPIIYMTAGAVNGRNVDSQVQEGLTTTFSYSAALYGGIIPHYVFNDGYIFYPNGADHGPNNKRYSWSG